MTKQDSNLFAESVSVPELLHSLDAIAEKKRQETQTDTYWDKLTGGKSEADKKLGRLQMMS